MPKRVRELEQRKEELLAKIKHAEEAKKKIENFMQNLAAKYSSGRISRAEYKQETEKSFPGRSPQEWIDYYNSYISNCQIHVKFYEKQIKKEKVKSTVKIAL